MHYDIICVQETKWRHDNTWSNQDFHRTPDHDLHQAGQGGRNSVCSSSPGETAACQRIPRGQSSVDIVNWYQYSVSDAEGVFDRRLALLTTPAVRCRTTTTQLTSPGRGLQLSGCVASARLWQLCAQSLLDAISGCQRSSQCASHSSPVCLEHLAETSAWAASHIYVW